MSCSTAPRRSAGLDPLTGYMREELKTQMASQVGTRDEPAKKGRQGHLDLARLAEWLLEHKVRPGG